MTEPKNRILVIEDNHVACTSYANLLRVEGYLVDTAYTLDDALEHLNSRTYHVAVVDVMLGGDDDPRNPRNTDGFKIVQAISSKKEGTIPIVLSALENTQLVADSFQEFGAHRFLTKAVITEDPERLNAEVRSAVNVCDLNLLGDSSDVVRYLIPGPDGEHWINRCAQVMQSKKGGWRIVGYMDKLLESFLPVRPMRNDFEPLQINSEEQMVKSCLWSKALGSAIDVYVVAEGRQWDFLCPGETANGESGDPLAEQISIGLHGRVYRNSKFGRDHFEE